MKSSTMPADKPVPTITLLYRQLPWALAASGAVALLVVSALWSPEDAYLLVGWAAAQGVLILLRLWLVFRFWRRPEVAPPGGWTAGFAAGAGAAGLLWGAAAVLFLDPADPVSYLVITLSMAGLGAGAVTTLASHMPSFVLFLLGSLGPLLGVLLAAGSRLSLSLAAMVVVFGVLLVLIARGLRSMLHRVLVLTEDKQRLIDIMELQVRERTAALEQANLKLRVEMAERVQAQAEAERARAAAERADRAKSKFLAAASHDLRQPAQSLVLFTTTLANELSDHPARRVVSHIEQAAEALRRLLDSLLDMSRLDAGTVVARVSETPLQPILDRLATEYQLRADDKGLRFRMVPTAAWCRTDPALLDRMLRNLIENALRYTERGKLLVGCRCRGDRIIVQVVDTGIGIPPDQLDLIFQEFVQVGNDRAQGLGLGLAIVSRLARMLEHEVMVRSRPGHGSCFSVKMPRAQAVAQAAGAGWSERA